MKIAIDFDGTICKRRGIPTVMSDYDKPVEGALDAIRLFIQQGHQVWIFTSNTDLNKVAKWLVKNNFPKLEVTNIKKPAHVYIDDRAIRFDDNWQSIRKLFT